MLSVLDQKVEGNKVIKELEINPLLDNIKEYISKILEYLDIDSILTSILELKGDTKEIRELKKVVLDYNTLIKESDTDKLESDFRIVTTQLCNILDKLSDKEIYNIFSKTKGEVMSSLLKRYNNDKEYYETLKI